MAIYTKQINGLGYTVYWRDKKPCKTGNVPSNIVDLLEHQPEVNDEDLTLESPYRKCVFDGEFTKLYRVINQQSIYICEKDFYDKTTGQIAQQVRLAEETAHGDRPN